MALCVVPATGVSRMSKCRLTLPTGRDARGRGYWCIEHQDWAQTPNVQCRAAALAAEVERLTAEVARLTAELADRDEERERERNARRFLASGDGNGKCL